MKSYLINMATDADRLTHMTAQFDSLGIAWERSPAVDMRRRSPKEIEQFRQARSHTMRHHDWTPGQIGNLCSQMNVWEQIGNGPDPWGAIFEDDVHIDARAASLLADVSWIPFGCDLVRLETTRQGMRLGKPVSSSLPPPFKLRRLHAEAWGTAAYLIHRDVARWLACTPPRLQAPTDWLLFHTRTTVASHLETLQLTPAPCIQDQYLPSNTAQTGFVSSTDRENLPKPSLFVQARPLLARFGRPLLGKQVVGYSGTANSANR